MPKLILSDDKELSCKAYVQNGIEFDGSFAEAKIVNSALTQADPVKLVTDFGDKILIDLSDMEYDGNLTIHINGTFTAGLQKREVLASSTDLEYVKVAKILLGEETS